MSDEQKKINSKVHTKPPKDTLMIIIAVAIFALGLIIIGYFLYTKRAKSPTAKVQTNISCVKKTALKLVEDEYMSGVFEVGTQVNVLENFYSCNTPQRGDIVYYKFSEHIPPVVRFVRGIPGDNYQLKEDKNKKGRWTISINGKQINSGDEAYYIESNSVPPLKTYELSRHGLLRDDEYILLGNKSPSASDSSNLGLINKSALVGKVVTQE